MTDETKTVRAMYEAFNRGEIVSALPFLAPSITFAEPPLSGLPCSGFHSGPRSVTAALFRHERELWEDFRAIPETLVDTGESVLVLGCFHATGRATGEPLRAPFVHECFVRGGRISAISSYPGAVPRPERPAEPHG